MIVRVKCSTFIGKYQGGQSDLHKKLKAFICEGCLKRTDQTHNINKKEARCLWTGCLLPLYILLGSVARQFLLLQFIELCLDIEAGEDVQAVGREKAEPGLAAGGSGHHGPVVRAQYGRRDP